MKNELFAFLRIGLGLTTPEKDAPKTVCQWEIADWYRMASVAVQQNIMGVVFDGVDKCINGGMVTHDGCTEMQWKQFIMQWQQNVVKMEMCYQCYVDDMVSMAKFFNSHQMPFMVIKGFGVGQNYPQQNHRPTGDLDVWFKTGFREADKVIHDELGIEIDNEHHHHTIYRYKGLSIENHYDFVPIHGHKSNRKVEDYLKEVAPQGLRPMNVDGELIYLPSANFNGVFLLRHAAMHFAAAEITLRHIVDWAMFVYKEGKGIDWRRVYDVVKVSGMEPFTNAICGLCVSCLGMSESCFPMLKRNKAQELEVLNEILVPAFDEPAPAGLFAYWSWMFRRWWQGRWKHKMVYSDSLFVTFITQFFAHLMKPKTLKSGRRK